MRGADVGDDLDGIVDYDGRLASTAAMRAIAAFEPLDRRRSRVERATCSSRSAARKRTRPGVRFRNRVPPEGRTPDRREGATQRGSGA